MLDNIAVHVARSAEYTQAGARALVRARQGPDITNLNPTLKRSSNTTLCLRQGTLFRRMMVEFLYPSLDEET